MSKIVLSIGVLGSFLFAHSFYHYEHNEHDFDHKYCYQKDYINHHKEYKEYCDKYMKYHHEDEYSHNHHKYHY